MMSTVIIGVQLQRLIIRIRRSRRRPSRRDEYPLSPERLAVSHAWKARGREESVIAAKGAPEAIADLCHLAARETDRLFEIVEERPYGGNILWFVFPCLDMERLRSDTTGILTRLIALEDHLLEKDWVRSYFRVIVAKRE